MTPHNEQVHHWFSINVPQFKQFQPIRPFAGSNGVGAFGRKTLADGGARGGGGSAGPNL